MRTAKHAVLAAASGQNLLLKEIIIQGDARGALLEMSVVQKFKNTNAEHAEILYTFPLPWGAVLLDVSVKLGEKLLTGTVTEKKQAEQKYEEALSNGDTAIMLEKNSDHSYSLNLGNIAPNETCDIGLQYVQPLAFEQDGLRLLIPTVIAPQYESATKLKSGFNLSGIRNRPEHDLLAAYPLELQICLHEELARARISCPSHPITVAATNSLTKISLATEAMLDRDFVLVLDQLEQSSMTLAAQDEVNPDLCAVMASFNPKIKQNQSAPISVNFLIDCSGSMAGNSINSAKKALGALIAKLHKDDIFSLSRFGTDVEHRSRAMWKTTEISITGANSWIDGLEADMGGTEMRAALKSTFDLARAGSSDIFMITDGEISDIDDIIEAATAAKRRIFIVGIGSSPAESHLRRLALATGGSCDFVAPGESVEPVILRMFNRLRGTRVTDVNLIWPDNCKPAWVSTLSNDIYDGDTVHVYALVPRETKGKLKLMGKSSDQQQAEEIGLATIAAESAIQKPLSRLAASVGVDEAARGGDMQGAKKIAVMYQLITGYTNFILTLVRSGKDKASDMPTLRKVKTMVPAGWSGNAIRFSRKQDVAINIDAIEYEMCRDILNSKFANSDLDVGELFCASEVDSGRPDNGRAFLGFNKKMLRYEQSGKSYLTPLGLCLYLLIDCVSRPELYADLLAVGVSAETVDWLKIEMGRNTFKTIPELIIVAGFLRAVLELIIHKCDEEFFRGLGAVSGQSKDNIEILNSLKGLFLKMSEEPAIDGELKLQLKEMTADRWPEFMGASAESTVD